MSDDEIIVFTLSLLTAGVYIAFWYARLVPRSLAAFPGGWRQTLSIAPLAAIIGIFVVLKTAASFDVRESVFYLTFYLAFGAAWVFVARQLLGFSAISFRDDAMERRNPAAACVIAAAFLAHAAIYAGANIGDGPGWWTIVVAGGLGVVAWYVLWGAVQLGCDAAERITVGRDLPFAVRISGYMIGSGIICARGSAGDWTSLDQTFVEFGAAWPALILAAAVIGIERAFGFGRRMNTSILVAAIYVAAGIAAVALTPPPNENPIYDGATPEGGLPESIQQ